MNKAQTDLFQDLIIVSSTKSSQLKTGEKKVLGIKNKTFLVNSKILVEVSIGLIKHHSQKQPGGKMVCLFLLTTLRSHSINERIQGRNCRQELGGRNCRQELQAGTVGRNCRQELGGTHLHKRHRAVLLTNLPSFLSYTTQDHLSSSGTTHFPHQSFIKKTAHRFFCKSSNKIRISLKVPLLS